MRNFSFHQQSLPVTIVFVFILFLNIIGIPANKKNIDNCNHIEEKNTGSGNHFNLKKSILAWWKKNGASKPLKCNTNKKYNNKTKLLQFLHVPEIKSFPCRRNETFRPYYFTGTINEENYLEGPGRLRLNMNIKEWKRLPEEEQQKIKKHNICFKTENVLGKLLVEIIGTFRNGSLHGNTKITYMDQYFSIASYKNGRLHGFQRIFNQEGNIVDAGVYENGLQIGHHWVQESSHLIYQDRNMIITGDILPTLIFAISDNGTLDDPIAGNYYPHTRTLEDAHTVKLVGLKSKKSDCIFDMDYKLLETLNYTYSVNSKSKVSLYSKNEKRLCDTIARNESLSSSTKLRKWFTTIDKLLNPKRGGVTKAHEVLWNMRPVTSLPDLGKSIKLVSDFNFDQKSKIMTARILGSQPLKVNFNLKRVKLDNERKPHGYNDIFIVKEHQHLTPKDKTLNWVPERIVGIFIHGVLSGNVLIETSSKAHAWMVAQNGILHGPAVLNGIQYLLETVS